MKIIGYDPYLAQPYLAKENGISLTSLADVLKADYVSLHPDLNETSFHMINDKAFGVYETKRIFDQYFSR